MSEDFGNNYVVLTDEDGNEVEFEHIDTVEVDGETYMAFIPAELAVDEEAEVVILKVVEEDGEEVLVSVEDDDGDGCCDGDGYGDHFSLTQTHSLSLMMAVRSCCCCCWEHRVLESIAGFL